MAGVEVSLWHGGKSESRLHCLKTWVKEETKYLGKVGLKTQKTLGCGFSVMHLIVGSLEDPELTTF